MAIAWEWAAFNTGLISNGLATLLGVAAGVPLGLWINRGTERRQDETERRRVAAQHLVAVRGLRDELTHNRELLRRLLGQPKGPGEVDLFRPDTDLWPAALPTLLHAIDDSRLLDRVSRAYHQLDELGRTLEARTLLAVNSTAITIGGPLSMGDLANRIFRIANDVHSEIGNLIHDVAKIEASLSARAGGGG